MKRFGSDIGDNCELYVPDESRNSADGAGIILLRRRRTIHLDAVKIKHLEPS